MNGIEVVVKNRNILPPGVWDQVKGPLSVLDSVCPLAPGASRREVVVSTADWRPPFFQVVDYDKAGRLINAPMIAANANGAPTAIPEVQVGIRTVKLDYLAEYL